MTVPVAAPAAFTSRILPPLITTCVPSGSVSCCEELSPQPVRLLVSGVPTGSSNAISCGTSAVVVKLATLVATADPSALGDARAAGAGVLREVAERSLPGDDPARGRPLTGDDLEHGRLAGLSCTGYQNVFTGAHLTSQKSCLRIGEYFSINQISKAPKLIWELTDVD